MPLHAGFRGEVLDGGTSGSDRENKKIWLIKFGGVQFNKVEPTLGLGGRELLGPLVEKETSPSKLLTRLGGGWGHQKASDHKVFPVSRVFLL